MKNARLFKIYKTLYSHFGPQAWWPADTPFEVVVGAILTQNTAWLNVEKAIKNLKAHGLLAPRALYKASDSRIARLIRPSGYYNIKTRRLRSFLSFLEDSFDGRLDKLFKTKTAELRQCLLGVNGIGPETADSILLYAANRPSFVVDAYTRRIFSRHKLIRAGASYNEIQKVFTEGLPKNTKIYNEYHALIVKTGKDLCRKKPKCGACPLKGYRQ